MSPDTKLSPREKFNQAARNQRLKRIRREKDRLRKTPASGHEPEMERARSAGYDTLSEVARHFGVSVSGLQHATGEGRLPYVQIGRTRFVKYSDYQTYLDVNQKRRVEAAKRIGKENKHEKGMA